MSESGTSLGAGAAQEPFAQTVARLRAERDGLRRAMRSRALIEQAKGVLMAKHRITADQAFAKLLAISQDSNIKLAQVAAAVVAGVSPPPASAPGPGRAIDHPDRAGQVPAQRDRPSRPAAARAGDVGWTGTGRAHGVRPDRPAAGNGGPPPEGMLVDGAAVEHGRHLLAVSRLHAARSYADIVAALTEMDPAPISVVLLLCEPDGALRLVAQTGLTPEVASQWGRIPPQVDVPLTTAARQGEPVWLPDPESSARAYPLLAAIGTRAESVAALPLTGDGRLVGVLGLSWSHRAYGGERNRRFLTGLGEVCGSVANRIAGAEGLPAWREAWLGPLLDAALAAAGLLRPVRDDGPVTDFAFEIRNQRAVAELSRHGVDPDAELLLTEMPGANADLLALCRAVLDDGRPRQLDDVPTATVDGDRGGSMLVRAVRIGDRVVLSWRRRSTGEVLYGDLLASERTAGVASFRWRPRRGHCLATPGLPVLLDCPGGDTAGSGGGGGGRRAADAAGVVSLALARRALAEGEWAAVRRATVAALRGGRPVATSVVTRRGRWLRVTVTPAADGDLSGTVQDISELRAVLARLSNESIAKASRR